ncbi:hypothetical protein dqs_1280 [Azoarcus olearius]|uniref:hypothetical protein n=1 Tax=Azoarcus sp. (strain BH72) TaxID=418699 RepID=UPI0008060DBD|nr:hypothetical protein [Azoarcus olearius]ANQ84334.1 hypothetical protein dqs_1280 [Azoarcus olearius]
MADVITPEESFEYSLHNFLQWLEVMTMEPVELCNAWGNYNVAWEFVSDLNTDGNAAITSSCSYLSEDQKQEIQSFLATLNSIPKSVLAGATSVSANQEAMSHPCWLPFKKSASALLKTLEPAAIKNRAYFSSL